MGTLVKITTPNGGGSEVFPDDYNRQNNNIEGNRLGPFLTFIDAWDTTNAAPVIPLGTIIQHGGVLYECITSDYTVLGSLTDNADNYIKIDSILSGDEISATWAASSSGYSFNAAYNGLYHVDGSQLLKDFVERINSSTYVNKQITTIVGFDYWRDQLGYIRTPGHVG